MKCVFTCVMASYRDAFSYLGVRERGGNNNNNAVCFGCCCCCVWSESSQPTSDFWQRAYTTADLGVLRQFEVPAVLGRSIPAEITDPAFFPLCGNGRLDTKEDYFRLYGPDLESIEMMRYPKKHFMVFIRWT